MSKNGRRHGAFSVDPPDIEFSVKSEGRKRDGMPIKQALRLTFAQMEVTGRRQRTIGSYDYIFNDFIERTELEYVDEIDADSIYEYLGDLDVSPATKLIRLKSIKAVLSRFFDNRWVDEKFWTGIQVKVDKKVKKGAEESDIEVLLSLIDKSTFIGFRDSMAILVLYRTGIRIRTLGELRERHIDFDKLTLNLDGQTLKSRDYLKLPIDEELAEGLRVLIAQNKKIRKHNGTRNQFIFITQTGRSINNTKSNTNAISKQLSKYAERHGLQNINAHAIRRSFAKNLLNRGASIALISKALGHSDLAVTTQYLQFDVEEVASNLRDYL